MIGFTLAPHLRVRELTHILKARELVEKGVRAALKDVPVQGDFGVKIDVPDPTKPHLVTVKLRLPHPPIMRIMLVSP